MFIHCMFVRHLLVQHTFFDFTLCFLPPFTQKNIWLLENKISQNEKTGKIHVRFVPMPFGSNRKSTYVLVDSYGNVFELGHDIPAFFKGMVQNSYWSSKSCMPDVQTI